MPEGDSLFQLAHRLQPLTLRRVTHTSVRVPAFAVASFDGAVCRAVWPYGKNLFMQFDEQVLHTHLKMEGTWSVHAPGTRWRRPGHAARVVLRLGPSPSSPHPVEAVGFDLGFVRVFPTSHYGEVIGQFGPDALAPVFAAEEVMRRLVARPGRPVGAALLDQSVLAGVGNEYRAEICFLCGIHPGVPVGEVDVERVVKVTRQLMWANRLSPLRVSTGVAQPGSTSYVFGRAGKPCRLCGTTIVKDTLGGVDRGGDEGELERIIWWCPSCQPTPPGWVFDQRRLPFPGRSAG